MVETAAHLVDHVFPRVPVRQWVLSFPRPPRLLFAARPDVLTRVLGVVTRALSTAVIKRAGLSRSAGAETAMVTFIQRFGSALNRYHLAVAHAAHAAHARGHQVYLVSPYRLAHYREGIGQRVKADPQDAVLLARYLSREEGELRLWVPMTKGRTTLLAAT